jgi:hypothetical protein
MNQLERAKYKIINRIITHSTMFEKQELHELNIEALKEIQNSLFLPLLYKLKRKKMNSSDLKKEGFKLKKTITVSFLLFICVFCTSCRTGKFKLVNKYQPIVNLNSDILVGPGECLLKTLQGTSANNNFYVNWVFISNTSNFIFQLESSEDGKHFRPFCIKQGASSPNENTSLMLCIKDTMQSNDVRFFRLKAIPQNYNLDKDYLKGYVSMVEASTIMIKRNKRNEKYSLQSVSN